MGENRLSPPPVAAVTFRRDNCSVPPFLARRSLFALADTLAGSLTTDDDDDDVSRKLYNLT